MPGALSQVKVLDLSRVFAGPWCTQILADLGADVIKVERPGSGDDTRGWGPPWVEHLKSEERPDSTYFTVANRGKRSVTANLKHPQGQDIVRRLAEQCDVFVENFKVGDLKRYGLDYDRISSINPRIVYCSITGYGQDGPYAKKPAYDLVLQGAGGLMSVTGLPDEAPGGGPLKVGMPVVDVLAGMYATVAILAAINHRGLSGRGQYIDIALLDCMLALGSNQAIAYLRNGKLPTRLGNEHRNLVPYQVFATADGYIVIAVGNDAQWRRLCKALSRPDLGADPRFKRMADRVAHRTALISDLHRILTTRTSREWIALIEAQSVPCGPINDYSQLLEDPQVLQRALITHVQRPDGKASQIVASPLRLQATPVVYERASPKLGEHTDTVLSALLGRKSEEISLLRESGAI